MQSVRKRLREIGWTAIGNYSAALLAVLRGLMFATVLGPAGYGVWGLASTIQTLTMYADFGVGLAVARDIPGAVGDGHDSDARSAAGLAAIWMAAAAAAAGFVAALAWNWLGPSPLRGRYLLLPALCAGMGLFSVAGTLGRALFGFRRVAIASVVTGIVSLVAGYAAAARHGVSGLIVAQAVAGALGGIALLVALRARFAASPLGQLGDLLRRGWTYLLPAASLQVFVSLDVVMASKLVGGPDLGLYSVALLGGSLLLGVVAGSVSQVVGQHLLRSAALGRRHVLRMTWDTAAGVSVILAPVCAMGLLVSPFVIRVFLPAYTGATVLLQTLLVAGFFMHSQFGFSTALAAHGRQMAAMPLCLALSVANIALDVFLVRAGLGILGIALGTLVANVAFALGHMFIVARVSESPLRLALPRSAAILMTGVGLVALLQLVHVEATNVGINTMSGLYVVAAAGAASWLTLAWSLLRDPRVTVFSE